MGGALNGTCRDTKWSPHATAAAKRAELKTPSPHCFCSLSLTTGVSLVTRELFSGSHNSSEAHGSSQTPAATPAFLRWAKISHRWCVHSGVFVMNQPPSEVQLVSPHYSLHLPVTSSEGSLAPQERLAVLPSACLSCRVLPTT